MESSLVSVVFRSGELCSECLQKYPGGYFLVDFYAPTTTVESIMEHLSRDTDVIRPNVVKHPLTQEVKECEGMVPVPLEEKLYSTKKRK
ncbi:MRPS6 [Cervus elaphus hippelaphus]|uniref:Small ribosomal subunit protein bS6m n=1 Tax=Cervus elaphus hippelaphus TaxID=46360 RepID=A0A212C3A6_CEREH|nr:MRPS6 [Cervus elaphus hippelaphus]